MSSNRTALLAGFAGALLSTLVLVAVLAVAGVLSGDDDGGATAKTATVSSSPSVAAARGAGGTADVGAIYDKAIAGVVAIQADAGSGSGFLIDRKGTIVTNAHVVEGARRVQVSFGEDGKPIEGRVTGTDTSSDLAVVKVDPAKVDGGLKPLELADSDKVAVGDLAVAIGNPFGLKHTATAGIVSALGRNIDAPDGFSIPGALQTDAAINPGNSGGPLLDEAGRVIGVNSQIATGGSNGNVGVGFAVPANTVRSVVADLADDGKVERPYLGISTSEATAGGAGSGAVVQELVAGGPAADAGLQRGDVITKVGSAAIATPEDVTEAVLQHKPGETVRIEYQRGGERRSAEARLDVRPAQAP